MLKLKKYVQLLQDGYSTNSEEDISELLESRHVSSVLCA